MFTEQNWNNLASKISNYQKDEKFTDIELVVENQVFSGHKVILASSSPYFETMFSTELSEKNKTSIEIHGLKKELFAQLFNYIYKREIKINEDNVVELLEGSNMLQLTQLTNYCSKFLMNKLNKKNVINIYRLADIYSSTENLLSLKRKCKFFIEQHFLNMIKNEDFYCLPFHLFENLIKSESLNIHNELDVFKSFINWILKEPDNRLKYVYSLMKYIRLPIIPEDKKENLINSIKNDEFRIILKEITKQDLEKNKFIENSNEFNNNNDEFKNLLKINLRWVSRYGCAQTFFLIGGLTDNNKVISNIIRINSSNFELSYLKDLEVSRFNHQTIIMDGLLYICGGQNISQLNLRLVEIFDLYENERINTTFMVHPRSDFGLVSFNGYLFAIGGSLEFPNLIERYIPNLNKFEPYDSIDDLPIRGFRVVKHLNIIYIMGGFNQYNQLSDKLIAYNPETKQVTKLKSMNEARASFCSIVYHDYIYVISGFKNRSCERYSIQNNEWSYISSVDSPVENCVVTIAFNKLLIMGGDNSITKKKFNKIHAFDAENGKWTKLHKRLPLNISCASLVKI